MPEMTGIDFLDGRWHAAPGAKLVLLTAYADTDVAIKAINDIGLDHYLMKPWAPPEERLFPVVDDLLADWERANDNRFDGIRVVGNRWSERSYDTRMFLARNHVHYQWLELERDAEAQRLHGTVRRARARAAVGAAARRRRCSTRRRRSSWPTCWGCAHEPNRRSTTSSWSAPDRPAWRPPSTAHPRGCTRRSSSATRPVARRRRAPASRTTSVSRTA